MAKKKRKPKGKKKGTAPGAQASSVKDGAARTEEEASEEEASEEEAPEEAAAAEEAEEESPAEKKPPKASKIRGRAARAGAPDVDPNLPRPDGEKVSNKGGLIFVAIVLGLIGVAIAAQFTMGQ